MAARIWRRLPRQPPACVPAEGASGWEWQLLFVYAFSLARALALAAKARLIRAKAAMPTLTDLPDPILECILGGLDENAK